MIIQDYPIHIGTKTIFGRMYCPQNSGKHPVLIFSHGHNGTGDAFDEDCRYYTDLGFVCYWYDFCGGSVNSRSTGDSKEMTLYTERQDLLDIIEHFSSLPFIDPDRIFLFGGSQGGMVTLLTAEEIPDQIAGIIVYFPALCIPDDWKKKFPDLNNIPETIEFWGLTFGSCFPTSIHDLDPFKSFGKYSGPVLIIHGDQDPVVPLSYSVRGRACYSNVRLYIFPGEGHGFSSDGNEEARAVSTLFLTRVLKTIQKKHAAE